MLSDSVDATEHPGRASLHIGKWLEDLELAVVALSRFFNAVVVVHEIYREA